MVSSPCSDYFPSEFQEAFHIDEFPSERIPHTSLPSLEFEGGPRKDDRCLPYSLPSPASSCDRSITSLSSPQDPKATKLPSIKELEAFPAFLPSPPVGMTRHLIIVLQSCRYVAPPAIQPRRIPRSRSRKIPARISQGHSAYHVSL